MKLMKLFGQVLQDPSLLFKQMLQPVDLVLVVVHLLVKLEGQSSNIHRVALHQFGKFLRIELL